MEELWAPWIVVNHMNSSGVVVSCPRTLLYFDSDVVACLCAGSKCTAGWRTAMQRRNLKLCCNATLIAIRARYDRAPAGHSAVDFHISGRCTDGIYYRLRRIVVIYIGIHELDYSRVITPLLAWSAYIPPVVCVGATSPTRPPAVFSPHRLPPGGGTRQLAGAPVRPIRDCRCHGAHALSSHLPARVDRLRSPTLV